MTLESVGASENERTVPKVSAPLRSSSIPPLLSCLVLSLRVRSGLIGFQCPPPSVDLKMTFPPMYISSGELGFTAMGVVQLKRYFRSEGFLSPTPKKYGRSDLLSPLPT